MTKTYATESVELCWYTTRRQAFYITEAFRADGWAVDHRDNDTVVVVGFISLPSHTTYEHLRSSAAQALAYHDLLYQNFDELRIFLNN